MVAFNDTVTIQKLTKRRKDSVAVFFIATKKQGRTLAFNCQVLQII
jgi:hypothetical protein